MGFLQAFKNILGSTEKKEAIEDNSNKFDKESLKSDIIYSPLSGRIKKIEEVNDPMFAEELMGKSIAIEPSKGCVVSPVNGVIVSIFNTKHAIAIKSDNGAEILIHIGINTVNLDGKYFTTNIKSGDRVNVGDPLIEFNIEGIKQEGYDAVTIIIIINTDGYSDVKGTEEKEIKEKDYLLEVVL